MARTPSGPLTADQLNELARAALDNAADLLDDASMLLAAGRWPRAYALGVLAGEEFGKFCSCVDAVNYQSTDAAAWAKFWKNFVSHQWKFKNLAGQYVDSLDWGPLGSVGDMEWLDLWYRRHDIAASANAGKMAGLYVDFQDNSVRAPHALVSEAAAQAVLEMVSIVVGHAAQTFSGDLRHLASVASGVPELRTLLDETTTVETAADGGLRRVWDLETRT